MADSEGGAAGSEGSGAGSFPLAPGTTGGADRVLVPETAGLCAGGAEVSEELIARLTTVPSATTASAPAPASSTRRRRAAPS